VTWRRQPNDTFPRVASLHGEETVCDRIVRPSEPETAVPMHPTDDPQAQPTPPPAPAALEPGELTDDELDKVSGGFVRAPAQVSARPIPTGTDPLL
jgi:hypothetical protein